MLHIGYHAIFIVSSIIAVSCLGVALLIQVPNIPKQNKPLDLSVPVEKPSWLSQFVEHKALPISFIMLLTSVCYSGVLSFINFYAKEIDLVETASFFFLMYLAILSRPLLDRKYILCYDCESYFAFALGFLEYSLTI